MDAVLRTRELSVRYGGALALDEVELEVRPGQLVGLIGPNGAGKTTLIDALTGFVSASGGVSFGSDALEGMSATMRARAGLVRTFQSMELFEELTVAENVGLAADGRRLPEILRGGLRRGGRGDHSRAIDEALETFGLLAERETLPTALSNGQRRLVSVARALAGQPRLLLLDEPAAGLDSAESLELGDRLREIVAGGVPILLVDHDMGLVLSVCDYLYVLEFGRIIAHGTPAEIRRNATVIGAYLGPSHVEAGA
jgi:branched-chain amino acid transport system ATP-binding protein